MDGIWSEAGRALAREFGDIGDIESAVTVIVRLLMAVLLAAVLGYERERHEAPAGLRTHMLVALGAALLVLAPEQAGVGPDNLTRVVQGVVSGIGFLGAGAILKRERPGRQVRGLTTAASIWATAAIGVAAGMGRELTALATAMLGFVILKLLRRLEHVIDPGRKHRRRAPESPER
ncbi:MAG TPA: MgtC/SapB family protein [Burkholderiaceae bacterium]|nr:MgtC/SapB family protein [Burkholderiaceae bacterium]